MKNKSYRKFILVFLLIIGIFYFEGDEIVKGATSPYDVESYVQSGWGSLYGDKTYSMRSGRNLVYDVYPSKYTNGGYQIVTKDFGKGSQPYLNFQGWAILFGYKAHNASNNETYIVAKKVTGNTGVGTTKVYGTLPINVSATEELEYNNQGTGVWNECPAGATNKDNQLDCNMRYDSVGFNAFIPLNDLFPDKWEDAQWQLFLVKRVDTYVVYTRLILPFKFMNRSYNGGDIDLTSGVNATNLRMIGTDVIRRTQPRQTGVSGTTLGYFTTGKTYTAIDSDEGGTTLWYGVSDIGTRWASTAYWGFSGDQAAIHYTPPPDNLPPRHISHALINARYVNGNDYWVQPNDQVYVRLRQYDPETGNLYQYLRLYATMADIRSQHDFTNTSTHNNQFMTHASVSINSATREENTDYGQVKWGVLPKVHGYNYDIQYYYRDNANNTVGYNSTGMHLRVDGVDPIVRYRNSADTADFLNREWADTPINVRLKFSDADSGYKRSRYAWSTSTSTPTSWSAWSTSADYTVTKQSYGIWYLHVQVEDNVGNVTTLYQGPYKFNEKPFANFTASPNPTDTATIVQFTNLSSDPNGDTLTYQWYYQKPGASTWTPFSTSVHPSGLFSTIGTWQIRLVATDSKGASGEISKPLTVQGATKYLIPDVQHTALWEQRRQEFNTQKSGTPDIPWGKYQFFRGETFVLVANTTIDTTAVTATLLETGDKISLSPSQADRSAWYGELWKNSFITMSPKFYYFEFVATYNDGSTQKETIQVEVINNNIYNYLMLHRLK